MKQPNKNKTAKKASILQRLSYGFPISWISKGIKRNVDINTDLITCFFF